MINNCNIYFYIIEELDYIPSMKILSSTEKFLIGCLSATISLPMALPAKANILSPSPVSVVVAEFINESDASWWKPKYKKSFKNMLTNALSNTGNFVVLEQDESAIEQMTKKRTLGFIPMPGGGGNNSNDPQAKYVIKAFLTEYEENENSSKTSMDMSQLGGGRMSSMFGQMGMGSGASSSEKVIKTVNLTFNVRVINPRTKAITYNRTIQGSAKDEFMSENVDMGFVKSEKKVENKFPIKRAVMQAMEESGRYLNCVIYLQDECIDEMDAKEEARQAGNEAMDLF